MYTNVSTMKKFIEIMKLSKIDERIVTLPIKPMYKVVAMNPQVAVGLTGFRCILKAGGGLAMWPIVYIKREHIRYTIIYDLYYSKYIYFIFFSIMKTTSSFLQR